MKKIIMVLFIFLLSFTDICFTQSGWFWQNPYPTGENLYSVSFIDNNSGIGVGNSGLIIKTTNGGVNWVKQNSNSVLSLGDVMMINASSGYICGDKGYILKTTNGGTYWSIIGSGFNNCLFSIYFLNFLTGYCSGERLIIKTTNGGINWIQQYSTNESIESLHFININRGFAVGYGSAPSYPSYLYKTTNGGLNWIKSSSPRTRCRDVFFLNADTGFIAGDGGISSTVNGGNNWNNTQYPGQFHCVSFLNFNTGFITGMNADYKGVIVYTTNGGLNYNSYVDQSITILNYGMHSSNGNGYVVGDMGQILKSSNSIDWISLRDTILTNELSDVFFLNEYIGYAISLNGKVLKTTNSGVNWNVSLLPVSNHLNSIIFPNNNTGFIIGNNGTFMKSTNSGLNWHVLNTGFSFHFNDICFLNNGCGFIVGSSNVVLKTTDYGATWSYSQLANNPSLNCIIFLNQSTGFCAGSYNFGYGVIYKTTDSGDNWIILNTDVSPPITSARFINSNTGFATSANGIILRTTNTGNNWVRQIPISYLYLSNIVFADEHTGFVIGYDNNFLIGRQILKTTNSGVNWLSIYEGSANLKFNSLVSVNDSTAYIVGSNGSILKTTDGGGYIFTIGINSNYTGFNEKFSLSQNYPNPFNPVTRIKYDVPSNVKSQKSNVKIIVYDILGREVETLVNGAQKPGSYEVTWDGSRYASGVYFYRLITDDFTETKKMVLIK